MDRSKMTCERCINFDGDNCRLEPVSIRILAPVDHWCSRGVWLSWSEKFKEYDTNYWGDWYSEEEAKKLNEN